MDKMKSILFMAALSITFIDVSLSCFSTNPCPECNCPLHMTDIRAKREECYCPCDDPKQGQRTPTRGQRQYINPFEPKEYPSENWGVGEAIKQGGKHNLFCQVKR